MTNHHRLIPAAAALLAAFVVLVLGSGLHAAAARPPSRQTITRTVSLEPARDNTLFSESGNISNGAGQYLFSGTIQRGDYRRAVLAFDLSGIPPGATVLTATLTLTMNRTIAGETPVSLHPLQQAWGEGDSDALGEEGAGAAAEPTDATWLHTFFDTDLWTTPGGDYEASPSATTPVGGNGSYTWSSPGLLADVQAWVGGADNFGWILIGDETTDTTAKRFYSREHAVADNRPSLLLTYEAQEYRVLAPVVLAPME
jgi:hypothetical protein